MDTAEQPADPSSNSAPLIVDNDTQVLSQPHFPEPTLPAGIPSLIPADLPGLDAALGGRPIPMRVGRPAPAAPAPDPGPPPAVLNLSGTFSGVSAIDAAVRPAVAKVRTLLGAIITAIAAADSDLPALLETIRPHADAARAAENFDIAEAANFHAAVSMALEDLRN